MAALAILVLGVNRRGAVTKFGRVANPSAFIGGDDGRRAASIDRVAGLQKSVGTTRRLVALDAFARCSPGPDRGEQDSAPSGPRTSRA